MTRDDSYTVAADSTLTVPAPGFLGNDDPLPAGNVLQSVGPYHGSITYSTDGSFSYTPVAGFSGVDSIDYCFYDIDAAACTSNTSTITITVTPAPPPVTVDDAYTVTSGTTLTVAAPGVLANDTNLAPDARATLASGAPAGATAFTLNADGSFTYTPLGGFTGTDTFEYCIEGGTLGSCKSNKATVTINVTAPAEPPKAVDDTYTTPADTRLDVAEPGLMGNDITDNGNITPKVLTQPAHGVLTLVGNDGAFTYDPAAGFSGADSFTYCLAAGPTGAGPCLSNTATVTITVTHETPHTTVPPTTVPPTTAPPTTVPPTTVPPTTVPPTTVPPTTVPPTTVPPTTGAPTTITPPTTSPAGSVPPADRPTPIGTAIDSGQQFPTRASISARSAGATALPRTGGGSLELAPVGLFAVLAGSGLILIGARLRCMNLSRRGA